MDKKVILIVGNPDDQDQENRFNDFISLYSRYFGSIAGGAFEEEDILIYNQWTLSNIESELTSLELDYVIIVLIGHGGTHEGRHIIRLNDSEIIIPGQLPLDADKQLYIIESCRNIIERDIPVVDLNRVARFREGGVLRLPITREVARERFDSQLQNTNNGITVCMSCSENQSAWGFFFSATLLKVGHNWHIHTNNFGRCLGINDIIIEHVTPHVEELANRIEREQTPEIVGDSINYPFSICNY